MGALSYVALESLLGLTMWRDKTRAHLLTFFPDDKEAFALVERLHLDMRKVFTDLDAEAQAHRARPTTP